MAELSTTQKMQQKSEATRRSFSDRFKVVSAKTSSTSTKVRLLSTTYLVLIILIPIPIPMHYTGY